jgi:hypothetical protein
MAQKSKFLSVNRIAASPAAGGLYGSKKQIPISSKKQIPINCMAQKSKFLSVVWLKKANSYQF